MGRKGFPSFYCYYYIEADGGWDRLAVAFKGVGCSFKELSKTQCLALKMTKTEATQHRKAILKIPLEFPSAPRRKAAQKGRM